MTHTGTTPNVLRRYKKELSGARAEGERSRSEEKGERMTQ